MPESPAHRAAGRDELRRAVRERLRDLDPTLEPLAEDLLGESGRIDCLARDGRGRAVVVLIGADGDDDRLLTHALAQRAWVAARVGDWLKLAPQLALQADETPACWLLAPTFSAVTRAAWRALGDPSLRLARFGWRTVGEQLQLWLDPCGEAAPAGSAEAPGNEQDRRPARGIFRSGLAEADLGVSDAERRALLEPDGPDGAG